MLKFKSYYTSLNAALSKCFFYAVAYILILLSQSEPKKEQAYTYTKQGVCYKYTVLRLLN